MTTKRYKALRSLHYVTVTGDDRVVHEGDVVEDASDSKIEALLADGFIREARSQKEG